MTAIKVPYLGRVGDMRRLTSPTEPMTITSGRGESVHPLLSGGTAVLTRLNERRTYSLPYSYLPAADADVLRGFYLRTFGLGPFVFVDPTVRNVLPVDISACGARAQAALGWAATAGTLTRASGAPSEASGSGVVAWTSASAFSTVQPLFDAAAAPVCMTALEPVTVSLWVKATSTATFTLRMFGLDGFGTVVGTLTQSLSVGTTWAAMSVTAGLGNATMASAVHVLPCLVAPSSGVPTTISFAGAQVEYGDARTAWQLGHGSPRVLMPSGPGREVPLLGSSNHTLTLTEI